MLKNSLVPGLLVQTLGVDMTSRSAKRPEKAFFAMRTMITLCNCREVLLFKISDTLELVWLRNHGGQACSVHLWTLW